MTRLHAGAALCAVMIAGSGAVQAQTSPSPATPLKAEPLRPAADLSQLKDPLAEPLPAVVLKPGDMPRAVLVRPPGEAGAPQPKSGPSSGPQPGEAAPPPADPAPADRSRVRYSATRVCTIQSYGAGFGIGPEPSPSDYQRAYLGLACDGIDEWGYRSYSFDYDTRDEAGRTLAGHYEAVILTAIAAAKRVRVAYREEYRFGRYNAYLTGVGVQMR